VAHYAGIMTGELSERTRDILTTYRRIAMVGVSGNSTGQLPGAGAYEEQGVYHLSRQPQL
jgi:hypothetical protein